MEGKRLAAGGEGLFFFDNMRTSVSVMTSSYLNNEILALFRYLSRYDEPERIIIKPHLKPKVM